MVTEYNTYTIAQCFITAIYYGDYSALNDDDIAALENFLSELPESGSWEFAEDSSFDRDEITGLMADCIEAKYFIDESNDSPNICDDDFVIDASHAGYTVSIINENFSEFRDAIKEIIERMSVDQFFPNVWYINDHGNIDLLSIDQTTLDTEIVRSWV